MKKFSKIIFFSLILFLALRNARSEDSLTLYVFKSPNGIEWESPKKLIRSVLSNAISFKDRMIGHVAIELTCEKGLNGKPVRVLTGMSYIDKHIYKKQLFFESMGFAVIFQSVAGRLEKAELLSNEIFKKSNVKNSPRLTFMKHLITANTCLRLEKYYQTYQSQKYYQKYGLPNNPRKREGAGCSAFGVSFLEVAGILSDNEKKAWSFEKKLSFDLIGGTANTINPSNTVSFFDIFFLSDDLDRWLKKEEKGRSVFFYDPDKMFSWIRKKIQSHPNVISINKMKGLLFDNRSVSTPAEPIWL
jgi:hypothetical protein